MTGSDCIVIVDAAAGAATLQSAERRYMQNANDVLDDTTLAVLYALAIKKMGTAPVFARVTGLSETEVEGAIERLEERGVAFRAEGNVLAMEEATELVKSNAAAAFAALRADTATEKWHARFDPLNRQFLKTITSWQTVDLGGSKIPNDHADPDYEEKVLSRIDNLVGKMDGLLREIGEKVPRLSRYRDRLKNATDKIYAGDTRYVSDVQVDSVHGIWFEMHEDVLYVLGKERDDAGG